MADPPTVSQNESCLLRIDFDRAVFVCVYIYCSEPTRYSSSLLFRNGLGRTHRDTFAAYAWCGYPVWGVHEQSDSSEIVCDSEVASDPQDINARVRITAIAKYNNL